ncbi:pyrroline-5-carboxylate reductase [Natronospirillum operosum]|uniref:Pyrroline-5-carboxylate reductase n=1 Tax=Natronospirillum operosum TaxID=2759953 RepID=A0A4Z0W496_9GAMM|nr:pyrroline-5-carboxylate reductase [Natronospirillum operosum]TGG90070.1 pyrroline-5-carboxylate reductase [Natronospirillum operosum]
MINHTATIAFIGTGNMAGAIIGGLLEQGYPARNIIGTTRSPDSAEKASKALGIQVTTDNEAAVAQADVVVLGVKPQVMQTVCAALGTAIQQRQPLVVSIAAGIETATLDQWLGGGLPVVRCMPNTPSLLGAGVSGLFANPAVTTEQQTLAETLFRAVGMIQWVQQEADMHTITAICGSAPAYFYRFSEALVRSAEQRGLAAADAQALVAQVALGAARMMRETGDTPTQLRAKVSSPGGTTVEALRVFDEQGLDALVEAAVDACATRSVTLTDELASKHD